MSVEKKKNTCGFCWNYTPCFSEIYQESTHWGECAIEGLKDNNNHYENDYTDQDMTCKDFTPSPSGWKGD